MIFGFVVLLICPLIKDIKEASDEFVSTKKNLAALDAKVENSIALKELYISCSPDFERIDALFVDSEVPVKFVNFLKETANNLNLPIEISLASSQPSNTESHSLLNFNLSLTGSFLDISKFLAKIENASYLIQVLNLKMERANDNDIKTSFSIKVFSK